MKILIVSPAQAGRGGGETVLGLVANGLRLLGHDVSVALLGSSEHPEWETTLPKVYRGPSSRRPHSRRRDFVSIVKWLREVIYRTKPDWTLALDPQTVFLAHLCRIAGVQFWLGSWLHNSLEEFNHVWALRLCDAHFVVSNGIRQQLREKLEPKAPITVVYNPIKTPPCLIPQPDAGPEKFIYVGRLDNRIKRVDFLLRGLAEVPRRCSWRLSVFGSGPDGQALRRLADHLGIQGNIVWHGWVNDPWIEVPSATALLLTSKMEGFGLVIAEANARGIPVVAAACQAGPVEIVSENNGWLFPVDDFHSYVNILKGICERTMAFPPRETIIGTTQPYRVETVVRTLAAALEGV